MICEALDFTLTQPQATLGAGALAVVAASIAYKSVLNTIKEQRRAEQRKRRVDLVLEVATEMHTCANRLLAGDFESATEQSLLASQVSTATVKLEILGLTETANKVDSLMRTISTATQTGTDLDDEAVDQLADNLEAAIGSLSAAIKSGDHEAAGWSFSRLNPFRRSIAKVS